MNPFSSWTAAMVEEHNARIAKKPTIKPPAVQEPAPVEQNKPETSFHSGSAICYTVPGLPVPKPRQTRSDKWKQRPCVLRYRDYADRLRAVVGPIAIDVGEIHVRVHVPVPKSMSRKKALALIGNWHRERGDSDNFVKSVMDALLEEDKGVYREVGEKVWCARGDERTEVTLIAAVCSK